MNWNFKPIQERDVGFLKWTFPRVLAQFWRPSPVTASLFRIRLVCLEHVTGWPIIVVTKRTVAETVLPILKDCTLLPLGAPKFIVKDHGPCFSANVVQNYVTKQCDVWKTVSFYAWTSIEMKRNNWSCKKLHSTYDVDGQHWIGILNTKGSL